MIQGAVGLSLNQQSNNTLRALIALLIHQPHHHHFDHSFHCIYKLCTDDDYDANLDRKVDCTVVGPGKVLVIYQLTRPHFPKFPLFRFFPLFSGLLISNCQDLAFF